MFSNDELGAEENLLDVRKGCWSWSFPVLLLQTSTFIFKYLCLSLSMFVSHPPARPPPPLDLLFSPSLCAFKRPSPSPVPSCRAHVLLLCVLLLWYQRVCTNASYSLTTSDRPAAAWDTTICGRWVGYFWGYFWCCRGRCRPWIRLPVCEQQKRRTRWIHFNIP